MRLKSEQSTNQRFMACVATCTAAACLMICLLTSMILAGTAASHKPEQQQTYPAFARPLKYENGKTQVNYDTDCCSMTNSYHQPHFTGNRSVIVQLFEWKFVDIAEECRTFLGPQGYAGVQLSPVIEHTVVKTYNLNHPWWERYEVVSYRLASRSGDESDFWSMSRICNDNGIRIYADVVLNHMAAPRWGNKDSIVNTSVEMNVNISNLNYPNVTYTRTDFHRPCAIENTQDAHEIRNCQLNGHPDLDHSLATVQQHIVEMLNKFIDMGVAGFRVDTAKYIWPIDLKKIFQQVKDLNQEFNFDQNARPFLYHDVFEIGLDTVSKTEYSTYGVVSEYLYPVELSAILNGKAPLSSLINWGPAMGFLAHEDSLVFIDSHDTQRGLPKELGHNHMLTYKQRIKYIMANAFMLVHPYGNIKRIMSSYLYDDNDLNQGPPVEDEVGNDIRSPEFNSQQQCTAESGWVCEHRWLPIVNMVKMANYFRVETQKEERVMHFQTNGPNHIAFCRGQKVFVAMNNDPERDYSKEVYTCLKPGIYCDLITGGLNKDNDNCSGRRLEINEHGYAQLLLPVADGHSELENDIPEAGEQEEEEPNKVESYGILVLYAGSKINVKEALNPREYNNKRNKNPSEDPLKTKENFETNESGEVEEVTDDNGGNEEQVDEVDERNDSEEAKEDNELLSKITSEETDDNLMPEDHDNEINDDNNNAIFAYDKNDPDSKESKSKLQEAEKEVRNNVRNSEDQPEATINEDVTPAIPTAVDHIPDHIIEEIEDKLGNVNTESLATADQEELEKEALTQDYDKECEQHIVQNQTAEGDVENPNRKLKEETTEQNEEQQEDYQKMSAKEISYNQEKIHEEGQQQDQDLKYLNPLEEANEIYHKTPEENQNQDIKYLEKANEIANKSPEENQNANDIVEKVSQSQESKPEEEQNSFETQNIQTAGMISTKAQKNVHNG